MTLVVVCLLSSEKRANAGGLEYPDNGVEGMGRGAAFTAKADDGTALIYNVAGFARQRGMRLTLGGNTAFHEATFQRAGVYPDNPNDPLTPWAGEKFPLVKSSGSPMPIPHLMFSTDLGTDRLTVAVGLYAPSVIAGGRIFQLGVDGKPSPARYDASKAGGLIAYPSMAAAYRVSEWLDIGVAANFVIASLEATSISSADLAKALCPNQEYEPCDSRQTVKTTGGTVAMSIGAMARPVPWLQIGTQFRTPYTLETEGTVTATAPRVQPATIAPGQAFLTQKFPWILRTGVRYIGLREKDHFEQWDLEADFTYEAWGAALSDGTKVSIPKLSLFDNINSTIKLGFQDTMSFRVGGAYNIELGKETILSLRAGAFHDTSATESKNTRLLFDTLAKTGVTAGLGLKHGAATFNLSFSKIFHETREVKDGELRPINGSQGGKPIDGDGKLYDPVNNGTYTASTIVIGAGVTIQLEELFGKKRVPDYGADYELTTRSRPASEEKPKTEKTEEEEEAKKNFSEPAPQTIGLTEKKIDAPQEEPSPPKRATEDRASASKSSDSQQTSKADKKPSSPPKNLTPSKKPQRKKPSQARPAVANGNAFEF